MLPSNIKTAFGCKPRHAFIVGGLKASHRNQLPKWLPIVTFALLTFGGTMGFSKDTSVSSQSHATEDNVAVGGRGLRRLLQQCTVEPQQEKSGYDQKKLGKGWQFLPMFTIPFSPEGCQNGDVSWKWDTTAMVGISDGGSGKDRVYTPFKIIVRDQNNNNVGIIESDRQETATRHDTVEIKFLPMFLDPVVGNVYTFGIEVNVQTDDWVQYWWNGIVTAAVKPPPNECKLKNTRTEMDGEDQSKLPRGLSFLPLFTFPFQAPEECQNGDVSWTWINRLEDLTISDGGSGQDRLYAPYKLIVRDQNGANAASVSGALCVRNTMTVDCSQTPVTRDSYSLTIRFPRLEFEPVKGNETTVYTFGMELNVDTDDWIQYKWDGRIYSRTKGKGPILLSLDTDELIYEQLRSQLGAGSVEAGAQSEAASIVDAIDEEGGPVEAGAQSSGLPISPLFWGFNMWGLLLLSFFAF